jgi:hypothetical protein
MRTDRGAFCTALLAALRARVASEAPEDVPLTLAAHLLAACEVLALRETALTEAPPLDPVASLLRSDAPVTAEQLLGHLLALDTLLGDQLSRDAAAWEGDVPLTPVEAGNFAIRGVVSCRRRAPSPLRALRERLEHPIGWDQPVHLLQQVHLWWHRLDSPVEVRHLPAAGPGGRPWSFGARGPMRVLLAPLFGVPLPCLHVAPRGRRWGFVTSAPTEGQIPPAVRARLAEAVAAHAIDLVVVPELLASPGDHAWLAGLGSPPRACLAGSWHVHQDGEVRNGAPLLDRRGLRARHDKRGRFMLRGAEVDALVDRGGEVIASSPRPPGCDLDEAIELGTELLLFDTPLGRATFLICADLVDTGNVLADLVSRVGPDLVFVVAMSPTTEPFTARMDELAHFGIATFVVNAAALATPKALVAACRLPWRGPDAPPHRAEVRKDGEGRAGLSSPFT